MSIEKKKYKRGIISILILFNTFVLIHHYYIAFMYERSDIPDGVFVFELNQNEELEIAKVLLLKKRYKVVEIKHIEEPLVFRYIPVLAHFNTDPMFQTSKVREKKQHVFEVRKNGIFQKTGTVKWRFSQWGIIGGTKAKKLVVGSNVDEMRRLLDSLVFNEPIDYMQLPFDTSIVYPFTSPSWITLYLLLSAIVIHILTKEKSLNQGRIRDRPTKQNGGQALYYFSGK